MPTADQDQARHSVRRTRIVLDAAEAVAQKQKLSFFELELEDQRAWLTTNMPAVISRAIEVGGSEYENLRHFNIFVVEANGNAVLYFEGKSR